MIENLNPEMEERYLMTLLMSSTARSLREDALAQIHPEDFHSGHYGGIWGTAQKLHVNNKKIDKRSLVANAESPPQSVDMVLTSFLGEVITPSDYPAVIREVKRCGALRRLFEATQRTVQRMFTAEDYSQALSWAYDELNALDSQEAASETKSYGHLLDEYADSLDKPDTAKVIPTPWEDVNNLTAGGLRGGRLYIVGARPGEGKSVIAHGVAEHAASKGHPSLVFSAEMGGLEVAGRMIANGATIEMDEITRRRLSKHSYHSFQAYAQDAGSFPLHVNERAELTLSYIRSECRAIKRRHGLDVVVVDYLQLLKPESGQSREQQVAGISRGLKVLSRELDVAVVVPAQLNRKSTEREKPSMADLRESGSIEADADLVMLLSRQWGTGDMAGKPTGMVLIDITKNRFGRLADFELPFRGHYSRIG